MLCQRTRRLRRADERQHYMSDVALTYLRDPTRQNPSVHVTNIAFLPPGVTQLLDIGRLTAKILCTHHNGAESFDTESLELAIATESVYEADNSGDQAAETFSVDGDRIERWMLKTLIGGLYSGKLWADLATMQGQPPPLEWLEVLYRGREFPDRQGLYWMPTEMAGIAFEKRRPVEVMPWLSGHPLDRQFVIGLHDGHLAG